MILHAFIVIVLFFNILTQSVISGMEVKPTSLMPNKLGTSVNANSFHHNFLRFRLIAKLSNSPPTDSELIRLLSSELQENWFSRQDLQNQFVCCVLTPIVRKEGI